jgi:hypothetical protein
MTRPAHRTVSRDGFAHLEHDNVSTCCYRTYTKLILRPAYDFTGIGVLFVEKQLTKIVSNIKYYAAAYYGFKYIIYIKVSLT